MSRVTLYRHAVETVFGFLTLSELLYASRVSRLWRTALDTMAPLTNIHTCRLTKNCENTPPITTECGTKPSSFARHITSYTVHVNQMMMPRGLCYIDPCMMNRLQTLEYCSFAVYLPINLPHSLTALTMTIIDRKVDAIVCTLIDRHLRHLTTLPRLESLNLHIYRMCPLLSLESLADMRELRFLSLDWNNSDVLLTDDQVDVLRAMGKLETMRMTVRLMSHLSRLLREPHTLQWKNLNIHIPLRINHCLASLTSLTTLKCLVPNDHSFLASLTNLTHLEVEEFLNDGECEDRLCMNKNGYNLVAIKEAVDGISRCVSLRELKLGWYSFKAEHMRRILTCLPHVHTLQMTKMFYLESLDFFPTNIHKTLTSLTMDIHETRMDEQAIHLILALPPLTHLQLNVSWNSDARSDSLVYERIERLEWQLPAIKIAYERVY